MWGLGWIVVASGLAAACSGGGTDDDSASQAALGRWTLPADVRAVGSHTQIPYENAPYWNGGAACSGRLRDGARALGEDLMDRFQQVKSIGGYACRRNTADSSRLSVHGTGKALDIFIPTKGGSANTELGDPVANWLVTNASEIGIQLIIWNRSVWRANGANEAPYGGPVPHVDHIHAELIERAAREQTPYFEHHGGGPAVTEPPVDAGTPAVDAASEASAPSVDGGHDAGKSDAGTKDAGHDAGAAASDAGAVTPTPTPTTPPAVDAAVPEPAAPPADEYNPELDDDGPPGETDSLGTGTRDVPGAADDGKEAPIPAACAAQPRRIGSESPGGLGSLVALTLATVLVRRRSRADRAE